MSDLTIVILILIGCYVGQYTVKYSLGKLKALIDNDNTSLSGTNPYLYFFWLALCFIPIVNLYAVVKIDEEVEKIEGLRDAITNRYREELIEETRKVEEKKQDGINASSGIGFNF